MQRLKMFFVLALICKAFATPTRSNTKCTDEEFNCGAADKGCIPLEWVCDNVKDCTHGKDEAQCNYFHYCPEGDFMCRNSECVSSTLKCNGIEDCSDGSDEIACVTKISTTPELVTSLPPPNQPTPTQPMCTDDEFSCGHAGDKACIPLEWVCDNVKDCAHGRDEGLECNYLHACPDGDFMCRSGECFAAALKCNGVKDCSDGSDEIACGDITLPISVATAPLPTTLQELNQSSSSAWKKFFILLFLMLGISVVIIYAILRKHPEFIDWMQDRVKFSSQQRMSK